MTGNFPTRPEALTTAWLSDIVGTRVRAFDLRPLGQGVGVIGSVNRLTLEADGAPRSLIVKFASPVPENRAVAITYDMYRREVVFYRELAGRITCRTPHCLAAEYDPDTSDFVLVLEDLGHCRTGDQLAGASLDEATAVVDALAALHGTTWNTTFPPVASHNVPAQRDGMRAGFEAGWPAVLNRFPDVISAEARAMVPVLGERVGRLIEALTTGDQCLIHADVRLDNVLFDGTSPVFVDWQSACTCSGEQDLAYFLTQSLNDDLRIRHLDELIERYHRGLEARGVPGHTLQDCRERFRLATVYLLCWAIVIAGTLDMGNDRGRRLARALLSRSLAACSETGALHLLQD